MTAHACPEHAPGSVACFYDHGCRCDGCGRAAERRRKKAARLGYSQFTDAEPVRRHLEALGVPNKTIAQHSGVSMPTIGEIRRGVRDRIHVRTARALLAVTTTRAEAGLIPAVGTRRRLQGLIALGWTLSHLADELGSSKQQLNLVVHGRYEQTEAAWAARVAAVYNHLGATPAPASTAALRARNRAVRNKWAPPAAWDDGTGPHGIDNPEAEPVGVRPPTSTGRYGHLADDLADAIDNGASLGDLEARFGMRWAAMERALLRAGYHHHAARVRPLGIDRERHANARKEAA
ncbi:MAG: hypothetical protein Q4F65_00995 [Propionibacteriaceae bacterium]|nr:hypothetical protein [Propionibacteriaceae bacterium]